jgi:DNA-directed RNA polymerase specialized sigma24 family protein
LRGGTGTFSRFLSELQKDYYRFAFRFITTRGGFPAA